MTRRPDERIAGADGDWSRDATPQHDVASATTGRAATGLSLKGRALAHLARREHSRAELTRKLAPHAKSPEAIETTLDELTRRGFLSDERVVEVHVHQRAGKLGTARIRLELERKGIDDGLLASAVSQLKDSEAARAWALWQTRFGARNAQIGQADAVGSSMTDEDAGLSRDDRRQRQAAIRLAEQRERLRQQRFLLSRGFSVSVVNAVMRRAGDVGDAQTDEGAAID